MTRFPFTCLALTALLMAASATYADDGGVSIKAIDGKTVIVQSGSGGFSGGASFQPDRAFRLHLQPNPAKMVKGSFLGVTVSPVTEALRSQLNLSPGVGLVVESVENDSPAALAGIQRYDVLQQFNDQILIDPQQFGVLVRLTKPGDEITLKILHQGEHAVIKAKLVEKEIQEIDASRQMDGVFNELNGKVNELNGKLTYIRSEGPMKAAMDILRGSEDTNGLFRYEDKGMTLQITQQDGKRNLVAKDAKGKVLYDGPINTEQDRKSLPPEVEQRLKQMEPTTRPKSDE